MSTDVENEAQGATGASPLIPQGDSSSPVPGTDRMTFAEKVTTAVLSLLGTMTVTMLGLALKRKKQAQGTEDAAWGISTETLQRQQMQIEARQAVEGHVLVQHAIKVFSAELKDVKLPPQDD